MKNLGIGLALSLLPAALFMLPAGIALAAVAVLAVFGAGLARQTQAGLRAARSGQSPLGPVLAATVCFWLGASAGSILGWSAVFAAGFGLPVESGLAMSLEDLLVLWVGGAVSGGVVVAVTGAWRATSRPA